MFRHLPPTAVPVTVSDLRRGLNADQTSSAQFRVALARYLGVDTCALAASGRTALYLLLRQLAQTADRPQRREVILPAYTCPALAKVTLDLGLHPRLIDILPDTFVFDPAHLSRHLGPATLAVICVHPFGMPQPVTALRPLTQAVGAVLIEDAAQSMGARINGRPVGTAADFGLFSLGPGKPLSTGGGGILCAGERRYGRLISTAWASIPALSAAAVGWSWMRQVALNLAFHPVGWWLATRLGLHRVGSRPASWGYKLRGLSYRQAAVGLALLQRIESINQKRRRHAERLIKQLEGIDFIRFPVPAPNADPIYLRLPLMVDDSRRRERLVGRLWAAGIGVGRMYGKALSQTFPFLATETYPGAEEVARCLLTLPTHHYLTNEDMARIARIFAEEASRNRLTAKDGRSHRGASRFSERFRRKLGRRRRP